MLAIVYVCVQGRGLRVWLHALHTHVPVYEVGITLATGHAYLVQVWECPYG